MRFAVDTGGTFTDLLIEDGPGLRLFKSPTTPDDPIRGVLDVLAVAAEQLGIERDALLASGTHFIHATTRALNAILTGSTARTALLTTAGHPDTLLFREGGRADAFDFTRPYPEPYVPRSLTFEVPERVLAGGAVDTPLDEAAVCEILRRLPGLGVEAVGVCLLWSIVNPDHERAIGRLIGEHLPGTPYTLSHELNSTIREYRRASSTCIDASLKPLMTTYLTDLERRVREAGFPGRVLMVTSSGAMLDARDVAAAPIHAVNSGPSMAPVAGRHFARAIGATTAIVADTGGTSYDVSVIRDDRIPMTAETWIGERFLGHMTGFPSVDVKSIGAGGGSIASVDEGGLMHVGPASAGSVPGPACYGQGGTRPTVTDACLVLGYIDPDYFLGGDMELDVEAARRAIAEHVGEPLGKDVHEAAAAILRVATEQMVRAIEDITLYQGIDPAQAVLVGGGGAAGLNSVAVARQLGAPVVVFPEVAPALSAAGALASDLATDFSATQVTSTDGFDADAVNGVLDGLAERGRRFLEESGARETRLELSVDARYPHQVWELELPLDRSRFSAADDVEHLRRSFHQLHERVFAIRDDDSEVECVSWRVRVSARLRSEELGRVSQPARPGLPRRRRVFFAERGFVDTRVLGVEELVPGEQLEGPAIVESPVTTIVVDPGAHGELRADGSLLVYPPRAASERAQPARIDGVQLAVVNSRLQGVVRSMMNTLARTGRSGVLNTARDFSCCIVTRDDELLAAAESLPIHVMSGPDLMARELKASHGDLRRGDAFLHNSPYHGNSHAADHCLLVPVVDDEGRHRFTVLAKAHQADCGNALPTTYMADARDVYEEGALIFPMVKVQEDYVDRADIIRMCRLRIRVPEQWWGDYLAMLGAARIGEQRLVDLGREIGWDALEEYVARWFDYSEQRMVAAIAALPSGRVSAENRHDPFPSVPDGVPVRAHVEVDAGAARIGVDLRDNPDCLPCGLNLTEATARTAAMIGVFNSLGSPVPPNAGSFRRLDLRLRENCCVGIPVHPASCSVATTNLADHVANAVQRAIAEIADGAGMAEGGYPLPASSAVISGRDPRRGGAPFVNQIFLCFTGGAAAPTEDAWLWLLHTGNAGFILKDSVEVDELHHPILVREQRILPDTEGAGRFRGAPSALCEYGPVDCELTVMYASDGTENAAQGARGGRPGGLAAQFRRTVSGELEVVPPTGAVILRPGETIVSISTGGGGYGDPRERDPARVIRDVREGWVSVGRAREVYGVAVVRDGAVAFTSRISAGTGSIRAPRLVTEEPAG